MSEKPFDFEEWVWEFIRQSFNKIGREYEENMKRFQGVKRFVVEYVEISDEKGIRNVVCVTDTKHTKSFDSMDAIVGLLNEQQDQINSLILSIKAKDRHLKNQQAAIKKLQDLCGESDSENAKLRIENKKLKNKLNKDL